MSFLRTALRQAARPRPRELSKPLPPPPPPLPPPPARLAKPFTQDTFTPAPKRSPDRPDLAPEGYSSPISASRVGEQSGPGTRVLTLNLANGVDGKLLIPGDTYRTGSDRERQAGLIRDTGASIVAFQEADVNVERSGHVNTALDVARRANGAFDVFDSGQQVPTVDINDPAPPTAIRQGADGTTLYQTPDATLITGESFSGDDRDKGVDGDTDSNATYGNALYVAKPERVVEAYTVALPHSADPNLAPPASQQLLQDLGRGPVSEAQRRELGVANEGVSHGAAGEPRSALVARVVGPDGRERTVINVHLSRNDDVEGRKRQLDYVANLVRAESQGDPPREVVVLGDFNSSTAEVEAAFDGAGLRREVGGPSATGANYDQVWVSKSADTNSSAQVDTDGASDHQYAGYTVLE